METADRYRLHSINRKVPARQLETSEGTPRTLAGNARIFPARGISPLAGLLPQGGVFEAKAEADEEMPVEMRPGIPRQF